MNRAAVPALSLLIAGCAGERHQYPSLAPRAAERQGFEEPTRTPAAVVVDPALDTRIAAQGASLDRIAAGFATAAEAARRAVGPGKLVVGSDRWLDAQGALAKADDWRAQASALAAEIDAAASARAAALQPPYPALEALRERVSAETGREAQASEALQASIPAA